MAGGLIERNNFDTDKPDSVRYIGGVVSNTEGSKEYE
jgi:hypothetical protein